jgi:hypothetical protein
LGAINYLPPIATIQTKSQKSRRVDLKAGLIKDDTGEHKNILLLLHEHAVANLDPITMKTYARPGFFAIRFTLFLTRYRNIF